MTNPDVCAFGVPWASHFTLGCLLCAAEGDRVEEQFWTDVAAGTYDAQGYTPAERRAQAKRDSSRKGHAQ